MRPCLPVAQATLRRLFGALLIALLSLTPSLAANDAEQKVYEQGYKEVKAAFDETKAAFDKVYGPVKEAQAAVVEWRSAVRRAQQDASIERIEGLVASGMTVARDEMVAQMLGDDALAALKKIEAVTGKEILLPDPARMLDLIRDPDDFANRYGFMYNLSIYERAFRDSAAAKSLAQAEALFEKGEAYLGDAGRMIEFVALFDPNNNAADGPIGRLKSVGAVLTYMQDITGEIPGLGDFIGFYSEAAIAFAGALERLDAKVKEARSGSLCGQLGFLVEELKALDHHITGGECALYMTDYGAEAELRPLKVWEHYSHGETFIWRDADGASAYLSAADMATLMRGYRALAASGHPGNRARANPDTFMSRAIVTTHARRIVAEAPCRKAASLLSSPRFAETLVALGVVPRLEPIETRGGTRLWPGLTDADEILGLCLFNPAMSRLMQDLVARYGDYGVIRLDLVSSDWSHPAAPRNPVIVVNGTRLVDGRDGTYVFPLAARIFRLSALADLGAPLAIEIAAEGFLPKTLHLPLSPDRAYAKIGLEPEPDDEAAAQAARRAAEAEEAARRRAIAEAQQAAREARERAEASARAAREAEERAEDMARAAAQAVADAITRIIAGEPRPPRSPVEIPPLPEAPPAEEAGDVAEDVETLTPDPDVAVGSAPADTVPLADPDPQPDRAGAGETGPDTPDSDGMATSASDEAAPGMGTQVPLTGLGGQVWLGDRIAILAQWTEPGGAAALPGKTEAGNAPASVTIASPTEEDIGGSVGAPAPLTFIWHGSEGVRFDPPSSTDGRTVARFERPGRALVWAQILRDGETIAEGRQAEVEVGLPSLSLQFDPARGAMPGEEITARILTSPSLDEDLFSVTWRTPASSNRLELDGTGATIRFSGGADEVIDFDADLRTAYWGDDIGTITASYSFSAGTIEITAKALGPRLKVWDAAAGGLVDAPDGRWLTGQQITLSAAFTGEAPEAPRWDWSVNPGTTIFNAAVQSPTVTRSEPGTITAEVVARDRDGRDLGRGSINLAVAAQALAMAPPEDEAAPPQVAADDLAEPTPAAPAGVPPPSTPLPSGPSTDAGRATGAPPSAASVAPPAQDIPSGCAPGTRSAQQAAGFWQSGLDLVAAGRTTAGLDELARSLALCPDDARANQVEMLRDRLAAAAPEGGRPEAPAPAKDPARCDPGGPDVERAAEVWHAGLGKVAAGTVGEGLNDLEASLALCPDPGRAEQLAALRARLAPVAPPPDERATVPDAPATPTLDSVAAQARADCSPGGARHAQVAQALASAQAAQKAGLNAEALHSLQEAQSICPDAATSALIAEVEATIRSVEAQAEAARRAAAEQAAPPPVASPQGPPPEARPAPAWQPHGAPEKVAIDSIAAVQNGPTRPSHIQVGGPSLLTSLITHHWNFGQGDRPGTIGIVNERGEMLGRWAAEGRPGQGGVPNAVWAVHPDIVIPAGRYTVIDSSPETWATNAETGQRGIVWVELQPVRDLGATTAPPAPPAAQSLEGVYAGTIDGNAGIAISFTMRGGEVVGTVRGIWDGDRVDLGFSGPAAGPEFRVPIRGTITDPYMDWPIEGQIWGMVADAGARGGWDVGNGSDRHRGTWQATR